MTTFQTSASSSLRSVSSLLGWQELSRERSELRKMKDLAKEQTTLEQTEPKQGIKPILLTTLLVIVVTTSCLISKASFAQAAGRLIMAIGEVSITRDGKSIPAKKDTVVNSGDSVVTGAASNAQLKLEDGGLVALRPNTEFKVKEFKYSGKPDGTEKAELNLVKGGVRAVTGAIGRSNRDNLKVDAVVATIGIRGTGFNIVFCDAACKAANPDSKPGLYAGVFEGRIAVSNQAGTSADLGVNRFAYVADATTAPQALIAPPKILMDSLEGQQRVKGKLINLNSASENSNALSNANAVEKSPAGGAKVAAAVTAESVNAIPVPLSRPEFIDAFRPETGFVGVAGDGTRPVIISTETIRLRAAEWNAISGQGEDRKITLNQLLPNAGSISYGASGVEKFETLDGVITNIYSIQPAYTATFKEGGSDGGAVLWGRWAGGVARIGNNYGNVTLEENQGWHYIAGIVPTNFPAGNYTFNVFAATQPTETRAGAQTGWQVNSGTLTVVRGNSTINITGAARLSLARDSGWATFNMDWSHSRGTSINELYSDTNNMVVRRTGGTINLCTAASGCAGNVSTGFYGTNATHAGSTYEFNTGSYYVQGSMLFKR